MKLKLILLIKNCKYVLTIYIVYHPLPSQRPLSHISWAPENRPHIVASYCDQNFSLPQINGSPESCIWDLKNPNEPLQVLTASSAPNCIKYNKDFHLLVGGLYSGQVALWDARSGSKPTSYSDRCCSHRSSCVMDVHWLASKSNAEFFSGAGDGQVLTWDSRKMLEPIERLLMDPRRCEEPKIDRAFGVTVLEFEPTIPAKFMVGTVQGVGFSCNRKGKTILDKIPIRVSGHD